MTAQRLITLTTLGVLTHAASAQGIATFYWEGPRWISAGEQAELELWCACEPNSVDGIAGSIFDITGGDALDALVGSGHASILYASQFNLGGAPVRIPGGWSVDIRQFASAFNPCDFGCGPPSRLLTLTINVPEDAEREPMAIDCSGFIGAVGEVDIYLDIFGTQTGYDGVGVPHIGGVGGPLCAADYDRDGDVDADDPTAFVSDYTSTYWRYRERADVNGDGVLNGLDVGTFLLSYSEGCG